MESYTSNSSQSDKEKANKYNLLDTSKKVVATLFDVMEAHGVEEVVCSPGSRNVPLILAARARTKLKKHVVVDERSAAFMALGIASVSQKPVALICTSGTAVLNYAPAVAEAYYQGIPLIVISADRPMEWIDQDDSQTIRQFEVLRNFIKESYELTDREQYDCADWYGNRIANDAMLTALQPKKGPVHINVRLSPPLNEMVKFKENHQSAVRIISRMPKAVLPDKDKVKELAAYLLKKKIMLTVGFMLPDDRLNKAIVKFGSHPNVTVMAETISNTHLRREDYAVDSALCDLSGSKRIQMQPDVVLSVGGALVSRMLKEFLRECAKNEKMQHWCIGPSHTTVDCFQALTLRIEADPALFISMLSAEMAHQRHLLEEDNFRSLSDEQYVNLKKSFNYNKNFFLLKELAQQRLFRFCSQIPWCEIQAFIDIFNHIPKEYNLFLSNGTAVRYAQIIPYEPPHASFCNRGVSGIEGSTSTAIGGEIGAPKTPTLLITGDMSMQHDLGGLAIAAANDSKLKIIVINNKGGGIFRFIRNTSNVPDREEYLCADPGLSIRKLSEAFGFDYFSADNVDNLRENLNSLFDTTKNDSRRILEVFVPTDKSALYLRQFLRISINQ